MAIEHNRVDVRWLQVSEIPISVRRDLAKYLDGNFGSNWEILAEKLECHPADIDWIRHRAPNAPSHSPTLLFFDECCTGRPIFLLHLVLAFDHMKNQTCITVLKEKYGSIAIDTILEDKALYSRYSPWTFNDTTKLELHKENQGLWHQVENIGGSFLTNNIKDFVVRPTVERNNQNNGSVPTAKCSDKRGVRVFVTYTADSKAHKCNVLNLCECLKRNQFSVSLDEREQHLLNGSQEVYKWHNQRYDLADYILIVVSPLYRQITESNADHEAARNAVHIHRRMMLEYMNNGRSRFIAVMMPGSTSNDVPQWFRETDAVYQWPSEYVNLFYRLMRPAIVVRDSVHKREQELANTSGAAGKGLPKKKN